MSIRRTPEIIAGYELGAKFLDSVDALLSASDVDFPALLEDSRQALNAVFGETVDDERLRREVDWASWFLSDPAACLAHEFMGRYIVAELS